MKPARGISLRLSGIALLGLLASGTAQDSLQGLQPFLKTHCYACHGPKKQKNDLRFDTLGRDLSDVVTLRTWQAILDQLNLAEMPPKKKPQPEPAEAAAFIETLTPVLREAYAQHKGNGGRAVLRRLNRIEFRNSLRDLLYLEGPVFRNLGMAKLEDTNGNGRATRHSTDPIRDFPADEEEEGFDNLGERLVMSDFLLKLIIGAAEESLDLATHREARPKVETQRYAGHIRTKGPNPGLQSHSRAFHKDFDVIYQRYREPGASTGGMGRVTSNELARKGVGTAGRYRITIEVSAHNQQHPWGELIKSRQDKPMLVGLHQINARRGGLNEGNPTSQKLIEWAVPGDGKKRSLSFETWLDATWLPWIGWENGPFDRSLRPSTVVEKYLPEAFQPRPNKNASKEDKQAYEPAMAAVLFKAGYQGPQLRVHSLTLEPQIETWPPPSHSFLYGKTDQAAIGTLILRFAQRAFRRPLQPDEVARYVALVEQQREQGLDRVAALRVGYTAILASPRFYYLQESETGERLDNYELASRLSYFLWSSMPDAELFRLAAAGSLTDPKVLDQQVERMLKHRNAEAFTRRFTERWLRLDKLGAMPPERGGPFRFYWDRQMEPQMVRQTDAFFAHLLHTNGPIREFIDSDYTFLNERVATLLYHRDDVWGDGFRKVKVKDARRGGILTQPSVMTATANGVDTSPVVRGVWVLENILGTPPSPPPPDVEPLAPDLRGAKTIREQLEKHRQVASCNNCHRKIDPLGFAMENFDPIGRWRTRYRDTKKSIDPSSTLSNGQAVKDIIEFKQALLQRENDVARCLTEKLLTYASGRRLEPGDRGEVDRIVQALERKGSGLRDLVRLVASSDVFLTK